MNLERHPANEGSFVPGRASRLLAMEWQCPRCERPVSPVDGHPARPAITRARDAAQGQQEVCAECGTDEALAEFRGETQSVTSWPVSMSPRGRMERRVAQMRKSLESIPPEGEYATFQRTFTSRTGNYDGEGFLLVYDTLTDSQHDIAATLWADGMELHDAVSAASRL